MAFSMGASLGALVVLLVSSTACKAISQKQEIHVAVDRHSVGSPRVVVSSDISRLKGREACASAYFEESMLAVGWNFINIVTNSRCEDLDQAYAAGYAEGMGTVEQIWNHWQNTKYEFDNLTKGVYDYIETNTEYMKNQATLWHENRDDAAYWWQVRLIMEQVQGLEDGYTDAAEKDRKLPEGFAFMMNSDGELYDLVPAYPATNSSNDKIKRKSSSGADSTSTGSVAPKKGTGGYLVRGGLAAAEDDVAEGATSSSLYVSDGVDDDDDDGAAVSDESAGPLPLEGPAFDRCSGIVKVTEGNTDLFIGQVAFTGLEEMYQMYKMYTFNYRQHKESDRFLPARRMTFSSYPGHVFSGDDFYIMSSGISTVETTIYNFNMELYKKITPKGTVLEWIRNIVANRLARTAPEWAAIFSRFNSGTYNNQWLILDYNLFTPGSSIKKDTLWILEQYPGVVKSWDATETLTEKGYVGSFNSPMSKDLRTLAGWDPVVAKFGDWFTPDRSPRALITERDHVKVSDADSFKRLLRYNDFKHDPLARCELCNPPYDGEFGISSRGDLNPANGTYPFPQIGHRDHASISAKATSYALAMDLVSLAIAGPTCDYVPVFEWSKSDFKGLSHQGHPDAFNFPWVRLEWEDSRRHPWIHIHVNSTLCPNNN